MTQQEWRSKFLAQSLHRNGVIIERAHRSGRPLAQEERQIIEGTREFARQEGMSQKLINAEEMDGERDWNLVLRPLKVVARFSYYDAPYEEIPAAPSYYIEESNYAPLVVGGHVCIEQLVHAGQKIPKTPTYEQWVAAGKKVYRGTKRRAFLWTR